MSICTCVGMCGCGGAIVAGVLYYHYSNCNNKNNEDVEDKTFKYSMV